MARKMSKKSTSSGEIDALHFIGYEDCPAQVTAYLKQIMAGSQSEPGDHFTVPSVRKLATLFQCNEIIVMDALNDLMMEGYDYTADDPESAIVFTKAPASEMLRRIRWWNWPSLYRYGMIASCT